LMLMKRYVLLLLLLALVYDAADDTMTTLQVRRLDVWMPNPLSPAVAAEVAAEPVAAAAPAKKK
jgi:hypothetical protein